MTSTHSTSLPMHVDSEAANAVEAIEIGLDLGTSKISHTYRLHEPNKEQMPFQIGLYNDIHATIPACVAYDQNGALLYGHTLVDDVHEGRVHPDRVIQCHKLLFYDGEMDNEPEVLQLSREALRQARKSPDELLVDHLARLYTDFKDNICKRMSHLYDSDILLQKKLRIRIACPQSWSPRARQRMMQASLKTGLAAVTTIASEPQAGLASYLDSLAGRQLRYLAGDYILVIDMGCGTIDYVLYRLKDNMDINGRLEPIQQSSGAPCGSFTVNEDIFAQIKDREGGTAGFTQARKKVGMSEHEFRFDLLGKIERIKVDSDPQKHNKINIFNAAGDKSWGVNVTRKMIDDAHATAYKNVHDNVSKILGDYPNTKACIVEGGFRKSAYMMQRLRNDFSGSFETIRTCDGSQDGGDTMVSTGLFSKRYPSSIDEAPLPPRYSYALLQDERIARRLHPDCHTPNGSQIKRKVGRSPCDLKHGYAIDRLLILIKRGEAVNSNVDLIQEYYLPCHKPVITARFVFLEGDHVDHGPALVPNHDVSLRNNALLPTVHEWAKFETPIEPQLLHDLKAEVVHSEDGTPNFKFTAMVRCQYTAEDSMKWTWKLLLGEEPYTTLESHEIWDAKASMFSSEHEEGLDA